MRCGTHCCRVGNRCRGRRGCGRTCSARTTDIDDDDVLERESARLGAAVHVDRQCFVRGVAATGGSVLEPAILLSGGNELPTPPGGLIPSIGINWYGTRVSVDWHNTTTGATGHSVSDEAAWQQNPGIPINRTWTGTGTVSFTVTVQTGAGWWFVNSQNAVCQGTISVVPGR